MFGLVLISNVSGDGRPQTTCGTPKGEIASVMQRYFLKSKRFCAWHKAAAL